MTADSIEIPSSAHSVQSLRDLKILAVKETKGFQWPTLLFSIFLISITIVESWLAVIDVIPLWVAMLLNAFWMAQGYTPVHECAHYNVNGKHRKFRWLNDVFGIAGFWFTLHSYTLHCHVHRLHHAHTNDPKRDTDAWVSDAPNLAMGIIRALLFYFYVHYFIIKIFPLVQNKRQFVIRVFLETAIPWGAAVFFALNGYGLEVLVLWVIPTILAFALVSFFIDWIPHHVEDKSDPIKSTLITAPTNDIPGKIFSALYNNHNFHLIHHLAPSVPWYAQERIFTKAEKFLNEAGARIRYPAKQPYRG